MSISYNKMWKLLIDKNMKRKDLKEKVFAPNPSFTLKEQLGYCGGIFGNSMGPIPR